MTVPPGAAGTGPTDSSERPPEDVQLFGSFGPDSEQQRHASEALKRIRDQTGDPKLSEAIDDVLAGRTTIRDLMRQPGMTSVLDRTTNAMNTEISTMSPEELDRLKKGPAL